jgi:hypothetical protein
MGKETTTQDVIFVLSNCNTKHELILFYHIARRIFPAKARRHNCICMASFSVLDYGHGLAMASRDDGGP